MGIQTCTYIDAPELGFFTEAASTAWPVTANP